MRTRLAGKPLTLAARSCARAGALQDLALARLDVEIELATSIWDPDFRKERFDLAIHHGDGSLPGSQLLMHDALVPVASPRLLHPGGLRQLADLEPFTWLHDSLRASKWPLWLAACGSDELTSTRHMKLQDTEATPERRPGRPAHE